jgi:transposase
MQVRRPKAANAVSWWTPWLACRSHSDGRQRTGPERCCRSRGTSLPQGTRYSTPVHRRAYGGTCAKATEQDHDLLVEVIRRPGNRSTGVLYDPKLPLFQAPSTGFVVLPKYWVVEPTHVWNERWRRMVMNHDRKTSSSAAWV